MNRSYEQGKHKGIQDYKQEDPEFWFQDYPGRMSDKQAKEHTAAKIPRSKSHSPYRHHGQDILNQTGLTDPTCDMSYHMKRSVDIQNSNAEIQGKDNDRKGQQHTSNRQVERIVKEKKEVLSGKRKKKKGKSHSKDRATMQFIRKMKADQKHLSDPSSSVHFSSSSDVETVDHSNRKQNATAEQSSGISETRKGTPVIACSMGSHFCTPSCGMCGLAPSMTHNAYVLHWLQQHTGHPQSQHYRRTLTHSQRSPCHPSHQMPASTVGYPIHSSPIRHLQPSFACPCTPSRQDVANELMTMIQQEASQAPYYHHPPGDPQTLPYTCTQDQQQVPIDPNAQSFLARLQHKPELEASPCTHHPTHSACMESNCHSAVGHGVGNVIQPCPSQAHSASQQATSHPPYMTPPRIQMCTQHTSPCSHCQPPITNQCSLEHAAMFLHQGLREDSPRCLNTSSLKASHGSSIRQALGNNGMPHDSSINVSQLLEDSLLSARSSFNNGSADRSKSDEKGSTDNPAPIGVFWDIENCAVPRGKSALAVVQTIRDRFFTNHREAEFMCVCDITKENATVIQELNDAQVTVAHINATAKNAADDKLKQSLRRFADTHNPPAAVVLISGDINFARDLSDLRHRNNLRVILVHRDEASDALKACANDTVRYQDLVDELPFRSPVKTSVESCTLIVHNLPSRKDTTQLRNRLKQLSENCGGKVIHMSHKNAVIQFPTAEKASRAKIRLDGENVYGNKISVAYPKNKPQLHSANSPARSISNKVSPESVQDSTDNGTADQGNCKQIEGNEGDQPSSKDEDQERSSSQSASEQEATQMQDSKGQLGVNASANRIAAAFRPIQQDMKSKKECSDDDKPVIEVWPKEHQPDTSTNCTMSNMNWPSSYSENHTHQLTTTGQAQYRADVQPGFLPFKPIPTVQRIPTPPAGSTAWNKADTEHSSQTPILKGTYRPPSPMLTNPMGDWQYMSIQDKENGARKGAELLVTNLDNKMSRQELKKCLIAKLADHCKVLHLIFGSPVPGRYQAVVRVPSIPDAIRAMASINRYQIGTRLLHVTLLLPSDSNADRLRLMIIPMLQEIPGMCLPLYDVKNSFEQRYRQVLYVTDLYHIPDTVSMRDTPMGKVLALTTQSRPSTPNSSGILSPAANQSPVPFFIHKDPTPEPCEPFCSLHDVQDNMQYRGISQDPYVILSLRTFSAQVHTLLQMHNGRIPLISFMVCYAAEFSAMVEDSEEGVALEHLLTCIQGVRVGISRDGYKTVCWEQCKPQQYNPNGSRSSTPLLPPQLFQFSKEAVELLKHTPRCRLAFSKFIPNYHHHFGRQCRVADYGFIKLIELFDAISHVLQVLGMTENKLLTLTHRTQIKRFSQDLLKVLKSQASKQMTLGEFPSAYLRCFNKSLKVSDYGVCDIQDLLTEVPENMAMISWNGDNTVIFIPKREQTSDELIRMRKFSREVVELLSHQPRYRILFSKFIPTFHHHFGHQCRVGDYGFNKLLELFEALPDVIQVEEHGDERVVKLVTTEQLALIAHRTSEILQRNRLHLINIDDFHHTYARCYMYPIYIKDFGVKSVQELMARFPHVVEIVNDGATQRLHLIAKMHLSQLAQQMLVLLLETEDGQLTMQDIPEAYCRVWHQDLIPLEYGHSRLIDLMKMLHYVLMVQNEWHDDSYIELTTAHQFARKARNVLIMDNRLSMTFQELVTKYQRLYGMEFQPAEYGHSTMTSLIDAVPRVMAIVNKGARRAVTLNPSCLVPGWTSEADKRNSLRRLSDQRLSTTKVASRSLLSRETSRCQEDCTGSISLQSQSISPSVYAVSATASLQTSLTRVGTSIASATAAQPTSGSSHSDSREEYLTPPEGPSSEGSLTHIAPSDVKMPRPAVNRNRGRCQLAANFSVK